MKLRTVTDPDILRLLEALYKCYKENACNQWIAERPNISKVESGAKVSYEKDYPCVTLEEHNGKRIYVHHRVCIGGIPEAPGAAGLLGEVFPEAIQVTVRKYQGESATLPPLDDAANLMGQLLFLRDDGSEHKVLWACVSKTVFKWGKRTDSVTCKNASGIDLGIQHQLADDAEKYLRRLMQSIGASEARKRTKQNEKGTIR